jgi:predicted nucleic acid-binding protein
MISSPGVTPAKAGVQKFVLSEWLIVKTILRPLITGPIVLEAVRGVRSYNMAYWDAQIWASARLHQVPLIFTDDFNNGAVIEGVRFVNPLEDGFDLDRMGFR